MAIELPDGKVSRTMPEQVGENARRIEVLEGYQLESFYRDGDKLYAKRVSGEVVDLGEVSGVANVALSSGSLIFTLTDGSTINAGLVKGISSMSIDGSQHLIVAYNNGTTEDLGPIFSGNVNIAGNLTADSIIENMSGYSFTMPSISGLEIIYAGIVKNGNKLTMVLFGAITPSTNIGVDTATELGTFNLIAEVKSRIYWYTSGSLTYVVAEGKVPLTYTVADSIDGQYYFRVDAQGNQVVRVYNKAQLTAGTTYHFRIEQTFLLSDNLAS